MEKIPAIVKALALVVVLVAVVLIGNKVYSNFEQESLQQLKYVNMRV